MKKLVLIVVAAAGAVLAKRQLDKSNAEMNAWKQATDSVTKS